MTSAKYDSDSHPPTLPLELAWARYEEVRARLPSVRHGGAPQRASRLLDVADSFDGFLFDSFGVLNVGETPIAGAANCLGELRRGGKSIRILTNAASYTRAVALEKYRRLGIDVESNEVVSSRDVALAHLASVGPGLRWGAIADRGDVLEDVAEADVFDLLDAEVPWSAAEGFLFLSSARWTADLQTRLAHELVSRPRPVVIGNPDLVAPRENGLTVEPGFWAHDLQDRTGLMPRFFGKPYPEAFDAALAGLGPGRYAMVGDTLHTDILGGQAAGLTTILVTDHGIFAGKDCMPLIEASGIVPDFILPSI